MKVIDKMSFVWLCHNLWPLMGKSSNFCVNITLHTNEEILLSHI